MQLDTCRTVTGRPWRARCILPSRLHRASPCPTQRGQLYSACACKYLLLPPSPVVPSFPTTHRRLAMLCWIRWLGMRWAAQIVAVAQGAGSEGTPTGWTWSEEGCTGAAWQGKGLGDGHCATSGTTGLHFADDVTEDTGMLTDKIEEIMSFASNHEGKVEGEKIQEKSWHCGKIGHVAAECW